MKDLINIIEKLKVNSKTQIGKRERNLDDWTLETAEDGDIIENSYQIFIFKALEKFNSVYSLKYHVMYNPGLSRAKPLYIGQTESYILKKSELDLFKLAYNDDKEALFKALKKEGYKWDEDKLELIEI